MMGAGGNLAAKRRLGRLWRALHLAGRGPVVVLYHSVAGGPSSLSANRFEAQVRWLAAKRTVTSLGELLDHPADRRLVAITFDDGYATLATKAEPILTRHGATATAFINTGWIEEADPRPSRLDLGHYEDETFMTWDQVGALARAGWTIGSHGVDHVDLTSISNPDEVAFQLRQSREHIRARGLGDGDIFAYTWGRHNAAARAAVRAAGYRYAAGGYHGSIGPGFDAYDFPRINVDAGWGMDDFSAVMNGDWDYLGWIQKSRRLFK